MARFYELSWSPERELSCSASTAAAHESRSRIICPHYSAPPLSLLFVLCSSSSVSSSEVFMSCLWLLSIESSQAHFVDCVLTRRSCYLPSTARLRGYNCFPTLKCGYRGRWCEMVLDVEDISDIKRPMCDDYQVLPAAPNPCSHLQGLKCFIS